MRSIEGTLTSELKKTIDTKKIASSEPYLVKSFRELVEHIAKLSYVNKDYLLFFRGQANDYRNKANNSTFYPTIYRSDYLSQREINYRFDILESASKNLIEKFNLSNIDGISELKRKKYIQWSVLQHYEVCPTPLLDMTQSLRVACSFAQLSNDTNYGFVFVFGLPYLTNRISINSEHDIINIRLLSICPPQALRPYFQEGFLVGTTDITNEYESKSELDFNNRLIAKFKIPNNKSFWGSQFNIIPKSALYPTNDKVLEICDSIKENVESELQSGNIGEFLKLWNKIEKGLSSGIKTQKKIYSTRKLFDYYRNKGKLPLEEYFILDKLRRFRNDLVHNTEKIDQNLLRSNIDILEGIIKELNEHKLLR